MQLTTIRIIINFLEIPGGLLVIAMGTEVFIIGLLVGVTMTTGTGPMEGFDWGKEVGRVMTRGSGVGISGRSRCELGFTLGLGVVSG